jgi:hypothetical protein
MRIASFNVENLFERASAQNRGRLLTRRKVGNGTRIEIVGVPLARVLPRPRPAKPNPYALAWCRSYSDAGRHGQGSGHARRGRSAVLAGRVSSADSTRKPASYPRRSRVSPATPEF